MNFKNFVLFLAVLLLVPQACTHAPYRTATRGLSKEIAIFYTANRQGEIEPCGCQVNQLGGIDRFQAFMERKRGELGARPTFLFDAGDTFFSAGTLNPSRVQQEITRAEIIGDAYKLWRLDAFTPGERDFALGVEKLRELEKRTPETKFIATNLNDAQGNPLFADVAVIERDGARVGVFSLASPESFLAVQGVQVTPVLPAARAAMKKLAQREVDAIVLLSHLGLEADRQLITELPELDLVVGSHSLDSLSRPAVANETFIFQPQNQGQQAGLAVFRTGTREMVWHGLVDLDKSLQRTNESSALLARYKNQVREIGAEGAPGRVADSKKVAPYVAHAETCRGCHQAQYDFWAKTKHSAAYLVLYAKNQHFDPECVQCHTLGFEQPQGFEKIARPLKLKGEEASAPFVETFLSSVFSEDGERRALDSRTEPARFGKLAARYHTELKKLEDAGRVEKWYLGVQCEHCHGNRAPHVEAPGKAASLKKVKTATCQTCHTPPNAEPFRPNMLPKVACPLMKKT